MSHAALKWLHSFTPGGGPFRESCCHSIIECAKSSRDRPVVKKGSITTYVFKKLIDRYALEGASAKVPRIAALCSLGFAVFFRFDELTYSVITWFFMIVKICVPPN